MFCLVNNEVILLLFSGLLGFLVVINFLINVWIVVDEYLLLDFVVMWFEKKYFNLKILCGVCMYFCVVICEIVDLCIFIIFVILFSIIGFIIFGLCLKKFICCCIM